MDCVISKYFAGAARLTQDKVACDAEVASAATSRAIHLQAQTSAKKNKV